MRNIDKALECAPKETDLRFDKQIKRFVVSIKQEKDNKVLPFPIHVTPDCFAGYKIHLFRFQLKQVKKLEAKQKMLLKQCEEGITLEAIEQFIQEDDDGLFLTIYLSQALVDELLFGALEQATSSPTECLQITSI